jgi:hypothetical protein
LLSFASRHLLCVILVICASRVIDGHLLCVILVICSWRVIGFVLFSLRLLFGADGFDVVVEFYSYGVYVLGEPGKLLL